jgi:molybdopterin-guanine dinucleotide biosynthesis protein A
LSEGRLAQVAAALLTGGASTRMGRDKAHLPVAGMPAAERLARGLAGLFEELLLVGGDPPEGAPGRRVADPEGPRCALRGVVGALAAARAPRVLVLATDLLALSPDLVLALVAAPEADAVVPRSGGRLHPLCALYRREVVLPVARAHLAEGRLPLQALLEALRVERIEGEELAAVDPEGLALANANTPEALSHLSSRLASGGLPSW